MVVEPFNEYPTDETLDIRLTIEVPRGWKSEDLIEWLGNTLAAERAYVPSDPKQICLYVSAKHAEQLMF